MRKSFCGSLALLMALAVAAHAAETGTPAPKDAAPTDPAFAAQGEYVGEIVTLEGAKKLGVQVIALGGDKFHAVGYFGGLPGDGWDGSDKKESDGEMKDGVVTFAAPEHTATIKDGALTITVAGATLGSLAKANRTSPTLGAKPPQGAVVLFDGSTPDKFQKGRVTEDGLLMQGVTSTDKFQSCTMHIEFRLPFMPSARGQGRGNSGLYLQGRYEVQMLDSFGLAGENNECGGLYEISKPKVNMCYPPLAWQTYDIDFTAAAFEGEKKVKNATITVKHNGVVIQENVELPRSTRAAPVAESAEPGPLYLQDHGSAVRYRNIWVVEKK